MNDHPPPPSSYSPDPAWTPAPDEEWESLEALEALTDEELGARLFGAPTPGRFQPVPVVELAGVPIQSGPGGAGDTRVVVDGVTVRWGRSEVTDQPDPATGRLRVFDMTGTWAGNLDLRGRRVDLRWSGTNPQTGTTATLYYWRGRVGAPIRQARRTVVHPVTGATITGALVDLPLVSILVDLANRVPTVDWPAETLGARATRVQTEAVAAGALTAVLVRDFWETPQVAPVAAAEQVSILDHLTALYDSSGADRYGYFPHEQTTSNLVRKHLPSFRSLGKLRRRPATDTWHPRAGKGVYAVSEGIAPPDLGPAGVEMYVDGNHLEYDPADGATQQARITRVNLSHKDSGAGYAQRTGMLAVPGTDEAVSGVRSASLTSIIAWNSWADLSLSDLAEMVRWEGSRWRTEPVRLTTRKLGGFEGVGEATYLLQGVESNTVVFLERTWLPAMGIRPVFGIMGATITYERGGWDLELELLPVSTGDTKQHALSWEEIDDGTAGNTVEWWDGDHPNGMHETLTLDDLGYVGRGLNVSAPGPDTGWDVIA